MPAAEPNTFVKVIIYLIVNIQPFLSFLYAVLGTETISAFIKLRFGVKIIISTYLKCVCKIEREKENNNQLDSFQCNKQTNHL